jgi:predicted Zn finger-like uncharacterized protein
MRAEIGDLDGYPRSGVDSTAMILSCPKCATGYFVEDGDIPAAGRTVRCAACGERWIATPQSSTLPPGSRPGAAGAAVPTAFRAKVSLRRRWREAAFAGAVLGIAAVAVGLIAGSAIVFRTDVARAAPGLAAVYAAIGLPVNRLGLVIEQVRAEPTLQQGHAALAVEGVIRNIEDTTIAAPPLRIALLDPHGRALDARIATAASLSIAPGAKRRFAVAILDPPLAATNLEVGFAPGAKGRMAGTLSSPPSEATGDLALKGAIDPAPAPKSAPAAQAASAANIQS